MVMDWVNLVIYIVYVLIVTALAIDSIRLRLKYRKLIKDSLQLAMDKVILLQKLEAIASKEDEKTIEKSDGFLKFISDSRDWAFNYIERAQEKIVEFGDTLEPLLHEDFLGREDIDKLATAYADLLEILPEYVDPKGNIK
jgi:hypothetical protein